MRYTISEMASLLGVTTHTLRYYEKMGLIRPEVNEETGYRYYTVTDQAALQDPPVQPLPGAARGGTLAGRVPGADRQPVGGAERQDVCPTGRPAAAQAGAG